MTPEEKRRIDRASTIIIIIVAACLAFTLLNELYFGIRGVGMSNQRSMFHPETMVYTTPLGRRVTVEIVEDCGLVPDREGKPWHKVKCYPIGFNNTPLMILDLDKLEKHDAE